MNAARIIRELITIAIFCAAGACFVAFGLQLPRMWSVGILLGLSLYSIVVLSKALASQLNSGCQVRQISRPRDDRRVAGRAENAAHHVEQPVFESPPAMVPQVRESVWGNLQGADLSA